MFVDFARGYIRIKFAVPLSDLILFPQYRQDSILSFLFDNNIYQFNQLPHNSLGLGAMEKKLDWDLKKLEGNSFQMTIAQLAWVY